jgi:hypothetical protein
MLLPSYHRHYWLGAKPAVWPLFRWLDGSAGPALRNLTVTFNGLTGWGHWVQLPGEDSWEPNEPHRTCAVASFAASYNGSWGWEDMGCDEASLPFICKLIGGFDRLGRWTADASCSCMRLGRRGDWVAST